MIFFAMNVIQNSEENPRIEGCRFQRARFLPEPTARVWANWSGQWWFSHPVTGAHYGPFDTETQARVMRAEVEGEVAR
jgi:hypothetical protein